MDALVFGRDREREAAVGGGDAVAFMGSLSRRRYTDRDGNEREAWSCLCDAFSTSAANPEWYPPEVPEVEDIVMEDDDITTLDLPGMDRRHEAEVVADLTGGGVPVPLEPSPNLTTDDEPAPDWYPPDPPEEDLDHSPLTTTTSSPLAWIGGKAEVVADLTENDIPF